MGVAGGDDALGVRAAVGIHEHGQRACRTGARTAAAPRSAGARSPARSSVTRGTSSDGSASDAIVVTAPPRSHGGDGPVDGEVLAARPTSVPPRSLPVCTPSPGGTRDEPVRPPRPQSDRLGGLARAEQDGVLFDVQHARAPASDGGVTGTPSTTSRAPPRRRRPSPAHPRPCARAPRARCRPSPGRCARGRGPWPPVAGSTRSARRAVWSRGWTTTSRPWSSQTTSARYSSVPPDRRPSSVAGDDLGADLRVRRARRRVGDDGRHPVGVRGIGDVPALNGRVVDAGDDQRIAVRATTSSRACAPSPRRRRSRRARSVTCGPSGAARVRVVPEARSCTCSAWPLT